MQLQRKEAEHIWTFGEWVGVFMVVFLVLDFFFSPQEFVFMKPKRKKAKDVGGLKDAQGLERLKAVWEMTA